MSVSDPDFQELYEKKKKARKAAERAASDGRYSDAAEYIEAAAELVREMADLRRSHGGPDVDSYSELADSLEEVARKYHREDEHQNHDDGGGGGRGWVRRGNDDEQEDSRVSSDSADNSSSSSSKAGAGPESDSLVDYGRFTYRVPGLDFSDVGGRQEEKAEMREKVIDCLENPDVYEEYGLSLVNGVLLYGPPGTGKTYLAKALAGELGFGLVEVRVSDIVSKYIGEAAKNVDEMFEVAVDNQPSVLFIDEIDGLVSKRGKRSDSENQRVNMFLDWMTRLDENDHDVLVVGATNFKARLDPAALRRLKVDMEIGKPEAGMREEIFEIHLRDRPVDWESIDLGRMVALTDGFTSDELKDVVDEAALLALKDDRRLISGGDLVAGVDRVQGSGGE